MGAKLILAVMTLISAPAAAQYPGPCLCNVNYNVPTGSQLRYTLPGIHISSDMPPLWELFAFGLNGGFLVQDQYGLGSGQFPWVGATSLPNGYYTTACNPATIAIDGAAPQNCVSAPAPVCPFNGNEAVA